jgi:hypothetical protein
MSEAALSSARSLLALMDRLHALDSKPEDPDHELRFKTTVELSLLSAMGEWNKEVLSKDVHEYLFRLCSEPARGRMTKGTRDVMIVYVVALICVEHGLKPTRARSRHGLQDNLSGCGIVATVLAELHKGISEDAVEKIWNGRTTK